MRNNISLLILGINKNIIVTDPKLEFEMFSDKLGRKNRSFNDVRYNVINPFKSELINIFNDDCSSCEMKISELKKILSLHYQWVTVSREKNNEVTFEDLKNILCSNKFNIDDKELSSIIKEFKEKHGIAANN